MQILFIAMIALAFITGFGCGWGSGVDILKRKLADLSPSNLGNWASKVRRELGAK